MITIGPIDLNFGTLLAATASACVVGFGWFLSHLQTEVDALKQRVLLFEVQVANSYTLKTDHAILEAKVAGRGA